VHSSTLKSSTSLCASITRTSLADSVYDTLLEAILSGRLPSGSELSEVTLAEQLEVSRTPIHEALRRLAADELVMITTGRTARVARLTRQDVVEIYGMRAALEAVAAELAAARITAAELAELGAMLDELTTEIRPADWPLRAIQYDLHFHRAVAKASGNGRLERDIQRYRLLVRGFCRMSGTTVNLENACSEHRRILDALATRDPAAARRAMSEHIEARLNVVLEEITFG
jgi:DNA-binding GntR family transcriptional regulator